MFPFTTSVAEAFVNQDGNRRPPVVESIGTGAGLKRFCDGAGWEFPDVANASRTGQTAQKTDKSERVEIEIVSAEQVRVNRNAVAVADLAGVLTPLVEASAERGVLISCGKDVPHGSFVRVLDITKQCGTAEISVIER